MTTAVAVASTDVVGTAAQTIADLDSKLQTVLSYVETEKSKIVTAVKAHVAANQAVIDAHQKEVDAASAIIATASPATPAKADDAAAIILTASTQVQGVVNFLGKNWRYVVGGLMLIGCTVGFLVLRHI